MIDLDDEIAKIILAFMEGEEPRRLPKTAALLDLLVKITIAGALEPSPS